MTTLRPSLPVVLLALVAACSSGSKVLSLSSYDTSCQQATDCIGVYVGPPTCCPSTNAAINKSDLARFQADSAALGGPNGTCDVACFDHDTLVPVCTQGTCGVADINDAGAPDAGSVACGAATCTGGEVCVMDQFEGGALLLPDAGVCPAGDVNTGTACQPLPTYHCAAAPAACASGLTCGCAQPLCDTGYTCQQAAAGLVQCFLMAP